MRGYSLLSTQFTGPLSLPPLVLDSFDVRGLAEVRALYSTTAHAHLAPRMPGWRGLVKSKGHESLCPITRTFFWPRIITTNVRVTTHDSTTNAYDVRSSQPGDAGDVRDVAGCSSAMV